MKCLLSQDVLEMLAFINAKSHRIPLTIFLIMCFNVLLSPVVAAATPGKVSHWQVYTISLLGLVTVALCIYLFVVIFQPEKF
ncbi:K(+)-transporting ATPase subunit F [Anabaena sp. CCY 9402-a]|uniref:K(+)-transporting ATPase subunit F n=1 Tax=Anabaena sp. CCY 9402-a TaxID=3103867 RepID=UPI0039C5AB48